MRILCLFVRHGTSHHPTALDDLNRWYQQHGLLEQRTLWIIDNSLPSSAPMPVPGSPNDSIRSGSNQAWEFSAWQSTLENAGNEIESYHLIHFVTSAFNTLYTRYLDHFRADMLIPVRELPVCLAHLDAYTPAVTLLGETSRAWVRTCFFFMAPRALPPRDAWVRFTDPSEFFESPQSIEFRPEAPLSANYRAAITQWLTGEELGGHRWHSPVLPTRDDTIRFQKKTLAILNEHHFSRRLRAHGLRLADFCWLWSTVVAGQQIEQHLVPTEIEQINVRNHILGIPPV